MNNIASILDRSDINTSTCIKDSFRLLDDVNTLQQLVRSIEEKQWEKLNGVQLKKYFVVLRNSLFNEEDVNHLKDIGIAAPVSLQGCVSGSTELNVSTSGLTKDGLLEALLKILKLALKNQEQPLGQGDVKTADPTESYNEGLENPPQQQNAEELQQNKESSQSSSRKMAEFSKEQLESLKNILVPALKEALKDDSDEKSSGKTISKARSDSDVIDVDVESWRLNRASELSAKTIHPWISYLLQFGYTKSIKDLRHIDGDWKVIRAITRWCSEESTSAEAKKQNLESHKRALLFTISKLSDSYLILEDSPRTSKSTSLLLRTVNLIDNQFHCGVMVTNTMIKEWISDFNSELDIPKRSTRSTLQTNATSAGKSVRKVNTCNDFNNGHCSFKDKCRFKHACKRHYQKLGQIESHPEIECTLEQ